MSLAHMIAASNSDPVKSVTVSSLSRSSKNEKVRKDKHGKVLPKHPLTAKGARVSGPGGRFKRPHKWRSGTVALREIRKQQMSTDLIFPFLSFERVTREVAQDYKTDLRFTRNALLSIQEAAEAHVIKRLRDAGIVMVAQKQVTLRLPHLQVANIFGNEHDVALHGAAASSGVFHEAPAKKKKPTALPVAVRVAPAPPLEH